MCGIIGYCTPNDIVNDHVWMLNGMKHQMHRGPDGINYHQHYGSNYTLGLGHSRLAIIDLSENGKEPIKYGPYTLTFNGEIYNYKYLRSYLTSADDLGKSEHFNDAHTLIRCISKYGLRKALNDVSGMFAFALHDSTNDTITLVTDHFNQKPLYYYHTGFTIHFASTPVVLYSCQLNWDIDHNALRTYWMLGGVIGENQIMQGIKKIPAGHIVTYHCPSGRIQKQRWYTPAAKSGKKDIESLVYDAIDEMKVSDVPVCIFLSGGIDSSLVASRFAGGKAIHLASPETEYAQQVADHFHIELLQCTPENYDIDHILKDYVSKSGEPTMAGPIPWITAKEARKHTKVAVIANGADELFFGYDRIHNDTQRRSVAQNNHMLRGSVFSHAELEAHRSPNSSRLTELDIFIQYDLNRTLDFASMCHGLEVRSPFLNHKLVEAALAIPELEHRKNGNKSILKAMLHKLGFSSAFTDRPKQGFSLHYKPKGMDEAVNNAMLWAIKEGWMDDIQGNPSPRDRNYLSNSALGFYYWYMEYKHRIA
jgi:asparagine synthase (glutamine-hydrolysing)